MPTEKELQITYLITSLETGGAQTGLVRLLNMLPPDEYNVNVVSFIEGDKSLIEELPSHVETNVIDITTKHQVYKLIPTLFEANKSDLLVCSLYHATIVGRISSILGDTPVINWQHNERFNNTLRKAIYQLTNPLASDIIADSTAVKGMLLSEFSLSSSDVHVVPIAGVDMETYRPKGSHSESEKVTVGTLGTLTKQKNHEVVLEIAEIFESSGVEFVVAGDGPRREELELTVSKRNIDNIRFEGYVQEPWRFLQSLDVYFQPSLYEGLCITVIEAMACGLPVVGSDVGGISQTVEHGRTGFIANPEDIDSFTDYLRKLISDPELRTEMGEASRDRVEERYSANSLVKKFCAIVDQY